MMQSTADDPVFKRKLGVLSTPGCPAGAGWGRVLFTGRMDDPKKSATRPENAVDIVGKRGRIRGWKTGVFRLSAYRRIVQQWKRPMTRVKPVHRLDVSVQAGSALFAYYYEWFTGSRDRRT